MTTREERLKEWSKILGVKPFNIGDPVKFIWTDLRRRDRDPRDRKTYSYGYVTGFNKPTGCLLVKVVKGGIVRDGVNVSLRRAKIWLPRKQ